MRTIAQQVDAVVVELADQMGCVPVELSIDVVDGSSSLSSQRTMFASPGWHTKSSLVMLVGEAVTATFSSERRNDDETVLASATGMWDGSVDGVRASSVLQASMLLYVQEIMRAGHGVLFLSSRRQVHASATTKTSAVGGGSAVSPPPPPSRHTDPEGMDRGGSLRRNYLQRLHSSAGGARIASSLPLASPSTDVTHPLETMTRSEAIADAVSTWDAALRRCSAGCRICAVVYGDGGTAIMLNLLRARPSFVTAICGVVILDPPPTTRSSWPKEITAVASPPTRGDHQRHHRRTNSTDFRAAPQLIEFVARSVMRLVDANTQQQQLEAAPTSSESSRSNEKEKGDSSTTHAERTTARTPWTVIEPSEKTTARLTSNILAEQYESILIRAETLRCTTMHLSSDVVGWADGARESRFANGSRHVASSELRKGLAKLELELEAEVERSPPHFAYRALPIVLRFVEETLRKKKSTTGGRQRKQHGCGFGSFVLLPSSSSFSTHPPNSTAIRHHRCHRGGRICTH